MWWDPSREGFIKLFSSLMWMTVPFAGAIIGLKASARAPIKYGENASPNMWETKIWVADAMPKKWKL